MMRPYDSGDRPSVRGRSRFIGLSAVATLLAVGAARTVHARDTPPQRTRLVLARDLPRMDGRHLRVTATEVNYGPGEASPPHDHDCPVVAYVAVGTVRSQVRGQPEATYRAGDGFYEAPHGAHVVSANASPDAPARFIAFSICDGSAARTGGKRP